MQLNKSGNSPLRYFSGLRLLLLILIAHTIVAAVHTSYQDVTNDEGPYYIYGVRWAHGQVERVSKLDDSKSPVTALSVIPRTVIQLFNPAYKAHDEGKADLLMGRYVLEIYTWIIAFYFFAWCRSLYGNNAWILSLLFFLFDPLVLSFSMLVISDMATGACVIGTLYHLYIFYTTRKNRQYVFFAIGLGISCVAKPSLLFLLPCLVIFWLILLISRRATFNFREALIYSFSTLFIILIVINAAYFFKHTFVPFGQQEIRSNTFHSLITTFSFLKGIPVPFPKTYFDALDLLQYHKEIGGGTELSSYPGVYLNGETKSSGGFWYYYFVVAFYKIPVAILLLLLLSLVSGIAKFNKNKFLDKHIWYVWPALFFLFLLSMVNSFQIGLRHMLMVYPLFFLSIAGAISYWQSRFAYTTKVCIGLFTWLIISIAISFPNLIAYTNEIVTEKKMVYKIMNDSNADYGQALKYIPQYIKAHPEVNVPGEQPKPGKYIASIQQTRLHGYLYPHSYTWLQHFTPVDQYKLSLLIYDISEEDLKKAGLIK